MTHVNRLANALSAAGQWRDDFLLEQLMIAIQAVTPGRAMQHYSNRFWTCCVQDFDHPAVHAERLFHFQLHIRSQQPRRGRDLIALRAEMQRLSFYRPGVGRVVAVNKWGRDCDGVEASWTFLLPANDWFRFIKREQDMRENAEGPCRMSLMSQAEYENFEPYTIDTYAETAGY